MNRNTLLIAAWTIAMVIALSLDSRVAIAMHQLGVDQYLESHRAIRESLKLPGEFRFTIAVAVLATILHRRHLKCGLFVLLATGISGVNGLIKWMVGRTRPFKLHEGIAEPFAFSPFRGGLPGLLESKNLCFPSGHAAWAFATAAAFAMLWPRFRWAFYSVAILVAIERVAENAHWLSDTVAAAALGVGGVWLIGRIWWRKHPRSG